tara:strand:+ start:892 stop:1146 length:255 start_codon:yes stop_codon:yes gene_type:complete
MVNDEALESRIRSRLKAVMSARDASRKSVGEMAGMSDWQIGEFFRERPLLVVDVIRVCGALGVKPSWVMFSDTFDISGVVDESI